MLRKLAFLTLLAGCVKNSDSDTKNGGGDDTGDTGDDTGDTGGDWGPAQIDPGAYLMTLTAVAESGCGRTLEVDGTELVVAPKGGKVVALWGYVPVETIDGTKIRGRGMKEIPIPDIDCTLSENMAGSGTMGDSKHFILDLKHDITGKGTECASAPFTVPCTEVFTGSFEWQPPPDTGATEG